MADPLDFGIDMASVQARLELLGRFRAVEDVLAASEALDQTLPAAPPAAFIGIGRENADPNRYVGGHAQQVTTELAVLFVEPASRLDGATKGQMEQTRKAIIRQLIGWTPAGAEKPLEYAAYRVVEIGNGLAWGEVTFTTTYRVSTAS